MHLLIKPYVSDSDAVDPDLDALTYSIVLGAEGMGIEPDTGLWNGLLYPPYF